MWAGDGAGRLGAALVLQNLRQRRQRLRQAQAVRALPRVCRELAELLDAGLTLADALACVRRIERRPGRGWYLEQAQSAVTHGRLLADAWRPWAPPQLTMMLDIGSRSGELARALGGWSEQMRQTREWRQALGRACAYPALLTAATLALQVFIANAVLPSIARMYETTGSNIPVSSRRLMAIVQALPTVVVCLLTIGAMAAVAVWWTDRRGTRKWRRVLGRLPGAGFLRLQRTQLLTSVLAQLLSAGVPILDALSLLATQSRPRWLGRTCRSLHDGLLQGQALSAAVGQDWDPLLATFLALAEATGDLASALNRVSALSRARLLRQVEAYMRALEPTLVVISGGFVAATMAILMLPMYDLMGSMSAAGSGLAGP
jgi:type II secretory pathway component PulF